MPSKSKSKGNKFENDMCKIFNRLYETEEFSRTPNSGAMMGRSNWAKKQGLSESVKRTLGSDIIVPDWFRFSVECKHYADTPTYEALIKEPGDKTLDHWLGETLFDAGNLGLHPMLIFKTNHKGTHVVLPNYFLEMMQPNYYVNYGAFIIVGLDVLEENAVLIKDAGLSEQLDFKRIEFMLCNHALKLILTLEK